MPTPISTPGATPNTSTKLAAPTAGELDDIFADTSDRSAARGDGFFEDLLGDEAPTSGHATDEHKAASSVKQKVAGKVSSLFRRKS